MRNYWAECFLKLAEQSGVRCAAVNYSRGWLETARVGGRSCFTKSMTFNQDRLEYFLGVDPGKLQARGNVVLLCGGSSNALRDVFAIRWNCFFSLLRNGTALNTYRYRHYLQYKCHLRARGGHWVLTVQGGPNPSLDVTLWRFAPDQAVEFFGQPCDLGSSRDRGS